MTSTATTSLPQVREEPPFIPSSGWVWLAVITGLFVLLHRVFLHYTLSVAIDDPNWSHAFVIPLISLYFLVQNRDRLAAEPLRVGWLGLPILMFGIFSYTWWIFPGRNDMLRGYSMIIGLFGLVWFLAGPNKMKVLWFPVAFLVFAVRVSPRIWEAIAWKLQLIAASLATLALEFVAAFMGRLHTVENNGAHIYLTFKNSVGQTVTEPINVAEACSGLRMLMAFLALGVAVAFLWRKAWWQKLLLVGSALPIAILINSARVTVIGVIYLYNKDMATGDFHTFIGMLMLVPALALLLLVGWVTDRILVGGEDGPPAGEVRTEPLFVDVPRDAMLRRAGVGVLVGVALMSLAGLAYLSFFGMFRPDELIPGMPAWIAVIVLLLSIAALFTLWVVVPARLDNGVDSGSSVAQPVALGVAAAVLLAASVGQAGIIKFTGAILTKKELPLRRQLDFLPSKGMGKWVLKYEDPPMSHSMLEELGTKKYISRHYVDVTAEQSGPVDVPHGRYAPGSMARVHVAYYTGTIDTVPHVPERCFVAGGARPRDKAIKQLHLSGTDYSEREDGQWDAQSQLADAAVTVPETDIDATVFTFETPGFGDGASNVLYFFAVNGKFLATPDGVRAEGFDPRDEYAYYCKIEVQFNGVGDPDKAAELAESFLGEFLPEVMACLPDWDEVTDGRYPPKGE